MLHPAKSPNRTAHRVTRAATKRFLLIDLKPRKFLDYEHNG
jgi:hypothetical protein